MPIPNRAGRQKWEIGAAVKVGFLTLTVCELIPTPGDFRPDVYILKDERNGRRYEFTPHNGLERIRE